MFYQMDSLMDKEATFKAEMDSNPLKQRAFELNQRIHELLDKRDSLKEGRSKLFLTLFISGYRLKRFK
jgi:hypothetical protein